MAPLYVRPEDVTETQLAHQRALYREQLVEEEKQTGKKRPEAAVDKIIDGKLNKWMTEVCLVNQASVQDEKKTIGTIETELTAKIGEKIAIRRFVRFELGEGIEKKKADLAAEVAETLAQN